MMLCIAAAVTACKRDKPNANHDIQKNQRQYMDEMDTIAKKLEDEEKKKAAAGATDGKSEKPQTEVPAKDPAAPAEKAPGGG